MSRKRKVSRMQRPKGRQTDRMLDTTRNTPSLADEISDLRNRCVRLERRVEELEREREQGVTYAE